MIPTCIKCGTDLHYDSDRCPSCHFDNPRHDLPCSEGDALECPNTVLSAEMKKILEKAQDVG